MTIPRAYISKYWQSTSRDFLSIGISLVQTQPLPSLWPTVFPGSII